MKNVTLSAEEHLIESARKRAIAEHSTLNEQFRRWLRSYAAPKTSADSAMALVAELRARSGTQGRKFSRDDMNER